MLSVICFSLDESKTLSSSNRLSNCYTIILLLSFSDKISAMNQEILDDLARNLRVTYKVIDNLKDGKKTYQASITLTNQSEHILGFDDWEIHFCHIRMIEPSHLPKSDTHKNNDAGILFTHLNGGMFKLSPLKSFKRLKKGEKVEIKFKAQYYSIARTDFLPNWYMTYPKLEPVVIQSTTGEELSFVDKFDRPEAWKRFDYTLSEGSRRFDYYNPFTVQERFERNKCSNIKGMDMKKSVIPTPLHMKLEEGIVSIKADDWIIVADNSCAEKAQYLAGNILPITRHLTLLPHNPDS